MPELRKVPLRAEEVERAVDDQCPFCVAHDAIEREDTHFEGAGHISVRARCRYCFRAWQETYTLLQAWTREFTPQHEGGKA